MDKETQSGKIFDSRVTARIFTYIRPYRGWFFTLVALTIVVGLLAPVIPWMTQHVIDNYVIDLNLKGFTFWVALMIGATFLRGTIQYIHTYLSGWLGQNIIRDIRIKVFKHITSLQLKFFDTTPIGRLNTRAISDIETLSEVFSNGFAAIISDILQLVFIVSVMFYMDWELTLVTLVTLPILLLSTYVFKEKMKVAFNAVRNAVSNLNTFVQEHISGMNVVQIFSAEKRELAKFQAINKEHRRAHLKTVKYYSIYFPIAEVVAATGTGLLVWYGSRQVLNHETSVGVLLAFIMYISQFFRPIRMLADRFNTLQLGIVSSDRIFKLLDSKAHIQNVGTYCPEKLQGNILFDRVSFAYNEPDYIIKDVSFEVKKGESIALVGATGAGKSSVINLINRFYDIQKGSITVDGVDIKDFDLTCLRHHIALVQQDIFLFSDSIRNNITLGDTSISTERIWEATELVGARQFIEKLPGKLEYNVMERGATLSVGQRQLLSFVRAIVHNPEIIVLDEATSSIDSETEALVQAAVDKIMEGRTAIIIAHRLSTIKKADKILVMDKGELKEQGTHSELIRQGGLYAQLHEIQFSEAEAI